MIGQETLESLLEDDVLTSRMPDVGLLTRYLKDGCPHGAPICMSFGETWNQVAPGLVTRVTSEPRHVHGYQLSMYGLPVLRRTVRDYLIEDHGLAGVAETGRDFEVAVTWSGTRSAMFDFGRLLLDRGDVASASRTPVVLAAGPSWDYEGALAPLGYRVRYHALRPETGFRPSLEEVHAVLDRIDANPEERLAMVVINAQHNPTAVNWDADFVSALIRIAMDRKAAILVDDAYFAVHDEGVSATSALRLLLCELATRRDPDARCRWLAVRSLGKQFHCNGWGLGGMVADPAILDLLVNRYRLHNSLMYGGVHQHAMADWLRAPESRQFLRNQQRLYTEKRRFIGEFMKARLHYPEAAVHLGKTTSYIMFAAPKAYASIPEGLDRFKMDCFRDTGVLFAPAWPWPYAAGTQHHLPYLRMFIGADFDAIRVALRRLADAGFHYDARQRSSRVAQRQIGVDEVGAGT
ncbi:aminotransferase class I/II-fold pyridoxal phosphate-dependent enzyme [Pendulispora brunnea]|uniref:Aminotransferase class I/II-fold pyridoxal phosphate-dependent enzyme n=1 Tax=Pendulispora brunnea TaxID=2905690 RepID=A0ABZ2KDJ9_9BACT